jgi:hypothetical protein
VLAINLSQQFDVRDRQAGKFGEAHSRLEQHHEDRFVADLAMHGPNEPLVLPFGKHPGLVAFAFRGKSLGAGEWGMTASCSKSFQNTPSSNHHYPKN